MSEKLVKCLQYSLSSYSCQWTQKACNHSTQKLQQLQLTSAHSMP